MNEITICVILLILGSLLIGLLLFIVGIYFYSVKKDNYIKKEDLEVDIASAYPSSLTRYRFQRFKNVIKTHYPPNLRELDDLEDYRTINFKKPIILITGERGLGKSVLGKQLALYDPKIQVLITQDLNHINRKVYNLILDNFKKFETSKIIKLNDDTWWLRCGF